MRAPYLRARLAIVAVALLVVSLLAMPTTAYAVRDDDRTQLREQRDNGVYILQLIEDPVVSYAGGIGGLKATKANRGQKIDPRSPDVIAYSGYLDTRHNDVLSRIGGGRKIYDYHYSFNGFAAKLTPAQLKAASRIQGVVAITKDELNYVDTSSTPHFLGLDDPNSGLWKQLGGVENAGEGIIIGDIDSGIWPDSESFSDRTGLNGNGTQHGKLEYHQIPGWHGKCTPGELFNASLCNQKLIGAQWFNAAWGGDAALKADRPWEFMSVRDYNGHGTHTASTAGGNHGVMPTGAAAAFGPISGMAPRARIAAYKALWSTQDASTASGFTSDLVEAIDQAVADGVDVINYSISGSTNFLNAVQVAFLFAADAGVFVSASAGNSGPTASTVSHASPWLTTVAAGTHNRNGIGSVTLGSGTSFTGASVATAVGPAPFIDSINAGLTGADATRVALCYAAIDNNGTPVLDPAKVAGKIVLCDRGVIGRVNKSLAVEEAGGVGMVLVNTSVGSLNADFHSVPTVHVQSTSRAALKAYAATAGATATINASTITFSDPAPFVASFSSRGPLTVASGDLLKPDVIAPGQDVLAAVAPPGSGGRDFNLLSGTSMSAPHVAGVAALLRQRHPDWTPMMIKSALMTTASNILDSGSAASRAFSQGAGHIRPNIAADPGLVYNSGFNDWLAFLCGTTSGVNPATCSALASAGYSSDASDMNLASLTIGDVPGIQTLSRKVTNVGARATYTATITSPPGFTATVTPASLTLNAGQAGNFTVAFTRTSAALNTYVGGQLIWSDGTHSVRSPVIVRGVALALPAELGLTGATGSQSFTIKTGYAGSLAYAKRGLIPSLEFTGTVSDDPTDNFDTGHPADNHGTTTHDFSVAAGTSLLRISMFDPETDGADDLDIYLYQVGTDGALTFVRSSEGGTAAEQIQLSNPTAATYRLFVHGFATDGPDANYKFHVWALGTTDEGNMTVTGPTTVTIGGTGTVTVGWSGLTVGKRYFGTILYQEGTTTHATTIIRVDP